jgi:hypothetical protein
MTEKTVSHPIVFDNLKARIEQLERRADSLRSGLDEIAVLFTWTSERAIPADALQKVAMSDEQVAAHRQWDGALLSDELVRLFLQAHTLATRLKYLVPVEEKQALIGAVVAAFRQAVAARHLKAPVEMEVSIGD